MVRHLFVMPLKKNNLDQVKILIANKADMNIKYNGEPLLIQAINANSIDLVTILLDAGCDYTVTDNSKRNILNIASDICGTPLLNLLLTKCPKIDVNCLDPHDGYSVLYNACYYGSSDEIIQQLLNMGANPNIRNNNGGNRTPLMKACENNSIDIVKLFLKYPAIDLTITDSLGNGNTALRYAEQQKNNKIVQLLKNHNRPKKIFDKDGTEKIMPIVKKPLYNIKVFCDEVPVPDTITIEGNTSVNCLVWNPTAENWDKYVMYRPEKFTVEVVLGKMACHECPELGLIQFDQLTMPDGTVRSHADLYQ